MSFPLRLTKHKAASPLLRGLNQLLTKSSSSALLSSANANKLEAALL